MYNYSNQTLDSQQFRIVIFDRRKTKQAQDCLSLLPRRILQVSCRAEELKQRLTCHRAEETESRYQRSQNRQNSESRVGLNRAIHRANDSSQFLNLIRFSVYVNKLLELRKDHQKGTGRTIPVAHTRLGRVCIIITHW